jgi:predicted Zn-dependent peptidase
LSARLTTLPSGLRIVTDASPHVMTASVGIFVGAGSRHERDEEHGLSHLLEHMAFKGTGRRGALEIAEAIENVGGEINAETSAEQTSYFAHVLRDDVGLAIDVLSDILIDSRFDPEELAREKNVIIQEIGAVEDTPDDLVFDMLTAAAWPNQAIGRPILGTREGVAAFDRGAISGYLDRHYRAGSTLVAAAGAVDHDELVELAERRLEKLAGASGATPAPARYLGGETLTKKALEQTHIVVGFPGRGARDPDHDAAHVFASVAGGGMSSRLFQQVREKRGLAYTIHAFHWGYAEAGLFGFYAGCAAKDAGELMAASLDCLAEAAGRLDEAEVARAKAQMKVSTLAALESPGARTQQLARQIFVHGRALTLAEMTARIDAIRVEDVRRAGAAMLAQAPTVAAIGRIGKVFGAEKVARRLRGA